METIYSAYGSAHGQAGHARSRYAGERIEADPGWYLLGSRPYDPVLRRFLAPDAISPFDAGGVNRYAYCSGDPINRVDPSGHVWENPWDKLVEPLIALAKSILETTTQPGAPATPVITAHTAAAVVDVATVSSGIPSGSLAAPAVPGHVVLGQLVPRPSTSQARGDSPPPAKRPRTDEPSPASGMLRYENMEPPQITDRVGRWTKYLLYTASGNRSIWVTNEGLDDTGATDLVLGLISSSRRSNNGLKHLWLYTGYEGVPSGQNWDPDSRKPRAASPGYAARAREFEVPAGASVGINVQIVDMKSFTRDLVTQKLKRSGVHVVAVSYGLMDPAVRNALNLDVDSVSRP